MEKKEKVYRTRNYATIVYPESAPVNWINILGDQHIPYLISPLHDVDLNDYGDLKKDHYHVMILFENVKTIDQAKEVFDLIGGVGVEVVKSLKAYARYLCHLDNPDKAQYDIYQVKQLGVDYLTLINQESDDRKLLKEVQHFIRDNDVTTYIELVDYCDQFNPDWYRIITEKYTYFLTEYVKSLAYYLKIHPEGARSGGRD